MKPVSKPATAIDPDYRVDWYRTPLPKHVLEELNERSDVKGWMQSLFTLGSVVATGSMALYAFSHFAWYWTIPALYVHGVASSFMINGIHELVHGTVFKTRRLNTLFADLFSVYSWNNHRAFWASHAEHHKFTLHDPHDQEVVVPITYTFKGFIKTATLNPAAMIWVLKTNINLARGRRINEWNAHTFSKLKDPSKIFNLSRANLLVHGTVLVISVANGWWLLPVVFSLHPAYMGGIQFLLNMSQHVGLSDHVEDFRLNSRSFKTHPLFRLMYWNMNYHIEHHMFAGVPCYNLGKLHEAVRHDLPYTYNGLREMWWHILTILWRQQHEPGYKYVPLLPGQEAKTAPPAAPPAAAPGSSSTESGSAVAPPFVTAESPGVQDDPERPFRVWECSVCGFIYDERKGLLEEGFAPGTRWEDIPDDWRCPDCGVAKADFEMVEKTGPVSALPGTMDVALDKDPIVIIGSGLGGWDLAREFRKLNQRKPMVLLTRDDGAFYPKPALSNALAHGRDPDDLVSKSAPEMATDLNVSVETFCEVLSIDPHQRVVSTASGEWRYGKLVLALGADPVRLPLQGDGADEVLSINDLADYRAFRAKLPETGQVAILGAGLIGCEFANDLAIRGYGVDVFDIAEKPLSRLVPEAVGSCLQAGLTRAGVHWHLNTRVQAVEAGGQIVLEDGSRHRYDLILSAVGLIPRTKLAAEAGLDVGRGIRVNAAWKTLNAHIFALGDCAEVEGRLLPYVQPILQASKAIALSLAGTETALPLPVMPVVVKTPACPVVTVPPDTEGAWTFEGEAPNLAGRCHNRDGYLIGFALCGESVAAEKSLVEEMRTGRHLSDQCLSA